MISINNINKSFKQPTLSRNTPILKNIDLTIQSGTWVSIVGPSGSGKTTLLKVISGLLNPDSGQVYYGDFELYRISDNARSDFRRKEIGFIFQDFKLLPYYSVVDNVMLPLINEHNKKELHKKAMDLLQSVGIDDNMFYRLPEGLSGGEKQRVAIARSLIADPNVLICDEPTGNLDLANRDKITDLLLNLRKKGKTIVLVTHDPEVAEYGDRLYHLKNGSLTLSEVGT